MRMGTSEQRLPTVLSWGATVSPSFLPITGVTRKNEEPASDSLRTVSWELVLEGAAKGRGAGNIC